jgi:hypothetical protein
MFETNAELPNFSLYLSFKILLIYTKIVLFPLLAPNNYKDINPACRLVFNRDYRLEIQSVMLVFSTGFVKHCLSNLLLAPPPLSLCELVGCTHIYSV